MRLKIFIVLAVLYGLCLSYLNTTGEDYTRRT